MKKFLTTLIAMSLTILFLSGPVHGDQQAVFPAMIEQTEWLQQAPYRLEDEEENRTLFFVDQLPTDEDLKDGDLAFVTQEGATLVWQVEGLEWEQLDDQLALEALKKLPEFLNQQQEKLIQEDKTQEDEDIGKSIENWKKTPKTSLGRQPLTRKKGTKGESKDFSFHPKGKEEDDKEEKTLPQTGLSLLSSILLIFGGFLVGLGLPFLLKTK